MVCMKWTSGSDLNVSNSFRNGGASTIFPFMVCALKDFKAWRFRNNFAAAKWVYRAAKWHSYAKGWFRSCETPVGMASRLQNGGFQGVEVLQPFRSYETDVRGCEMALMCQRASSQLRRFSQRRMGSCESISQREVIFATGHFWLRNFAGHALSLLLSSSWFPTSFFHLFWHSSWFWSSKNLCYIKTN